MTPLDLFRDELNPIQNEAIKQVEWRNEKVIAHLRLWLLCLGNMIMDMIQVFTIWQGLDTSGLILFDSALVLYALLAFGITRGQYKAWVKYLLIPADILLCTAYSYVSLPGVLTLGYFLLIMLLGIMRYRPRLVLITALEAVLGYVVIVTFWATDNIIYLWPMPNNPVRLIYTDVLDGLTGGFVILLAGAMMSFITAQTRGLVIRSTQRDQLARFLPKELIEQVEAGKLNLDQGGQRIQATILFSDIRDFTSLTEKLPPERIVYLLNRYAEKMVQAIFAHGGMLDKFTGDGIMAVFGPFSQAVNDQVQAAKAAVSMQLALNELNEELILEGLPTIRMGVGLATGEVVAGGIGTKERMDYTVIGDPVNLASRIQGLSRDMGVDILTEDATVSRIGDSVPISEIGVVKIRGKEKPLRLWTLLSQKIKETEEETTIKPEE